MGSITIVGLGPGEGRYLTREAWQVLESAETLHLRTRHHPTVADLPPHLNLHSFDHLYTESTDFESVYAQITMTIVQLGRETDVVYAVPGHPSVGEATVAAIEQQADDIPVRIVAGLSFVEPTLTALKIDALDGLQVFDAISLAGYNHPPINVDAPLLLGQLYSAFLASELKLGLMALYAPDHQVTLLHGAGTITEAIEWLPLHQIDRSKSIGNLTSLFIPPRSEIGSLSNLADTIAHLRSPNGCAWDREQTPQTLRPFLLEEAAEVLDALDRDAVDDLHEELGDLLFHIVMQSQMASEAGDFTLTDVIEGIDAKIKRRHPHVWGDLQFNDRAELSQVWANIKAQEKAEKGGGDAPKSTLDNIPTALSALARSQKIQSRVRKVGFDWPTIAGVWDKLDEEIDELKEAETVEEQSAELGDLLFVTVNLAKWMGIDAETALREANLRFIQRFQLVETLMTQRGIIFDGIQIDLLEQLWQEAKANLDQPC